MAAPAAKAFAKAGLGSVEERGFRKIAPDISIGWGAWQIHGDSFGNFSYLAAKKTEYRFLQRYAD